MCSSSSVNRPIGWNVRPGGVLSGGIYISYLVGLSAIRAAAARHGLYALDLIADGLVEDSVGQEDQPVRAGVGVGVLAGFAGAEYARLSCVHSFTTFLWAGSRGAATPAGPFPSLVHAVSHACNSFASTIH